jgi:predicted transposase YdaD
MAQEAFSMVSRDHEERIRLMKEYKYAMDLQDKMVTARREGRDEGRQEGRQEERQESRARFLAMVKQGLSAEEIERLLMAE